MKVKHLLLSTLVIAFGAFLISNISAHSTGMTGRTQKPGSTPGCTCHGSNPTTSVNVRILGPSSLAPNDSAIYTVKISGAPLAAAGTDIASSAGDLRLTTGESFLQRVLVGTDYELTHTSPKAPVSDTVTFTFRYKAPSTPNTTATLYANGNSVNLNGSSSGDNWNYAANKVINITTSSVINVGNNADSYSLSQNYPNPFNPVTNIKYSVKNSGFVSIKIYDNLGRVAATLVNENQKSGTYEVKFSSAEYGLSSGVYFYKMQAGDFSELRKMVITK